MKEKVYRTEVFDCLDKNEYPDRKVKVGMMFRARRADIAKPGFDGSRDKTGVIVVKCGEDRPDRSNYARSFLSFNGGSLKDGKLVWRPSLTTSAMFWVKIAGEHECRRSEYTISGGEVMSLARKMGMNPKGAIDALNRMKVCPVCGQGQLVDWMQLDPFSDLALAYFDERDRDGKLVGSTGKEMLDTLLGKMDSFDNEFRIPGVVARTSYGFDEPENLPDQEIYMYLVNEARSHVDKKGNKHPLRCDLLNNLDTDEAVIYDLKFAAEPFQGGWSTFQQIDDGIKSPSDLPYSVNIKVFLRGAVAGEPPRLKTKAWAEARHDERKKAVLKLRNTGF